MNAQQLKEAVGATQSVLNVLLQAVATGGGGTPAAQAGAAIGTLLSNAAAELNALTDTEQQFFVDLANCFELTQQAGATFAGMDLVRAAAEALTPINPPAIAVQNFSLRMALVEEVRILAATTFTSRQQIDNYFAQINVTFPAAIDTAANNLDQVAYQALTALYAACSNDLATRSRPLPSIVSYTFPTRMPALWLAQRLYQDPTRAKQLIAENMPINPLFMPATGIALSS